MCWGETNREGLELNRVNRDKLWGALALAQEGDWITGMNCIF